ncbi:2-hydroxyacid dehydrogenase [Mesorhizobium sp. CN2-181]|uniref:2-hydroxyacid dehydrogenase n=1 Tax=Mesorhizobium yinganensis TaxID=3157707 RepID=UPI0032B7FF55
MPLSDVTILVPGGIHERVLARLGETFRLVRIERPDAALITGDLRASVRGVASVAGANAAFIDALPNVEIIANFGVGYDGVDARHAATRGIMVTNTPDVLTEEVADTALGLLLNTLREFSRAERWLRDGRWVKDGPYPLTRTTLRGRKIGILGMGRIGKAIARRLEGFGVPIAYHNRRPAADVAYPYFDTLEGLAREVDTLISIMPGGAATEKMIGRAVFEALGPDGVFINIGRGSTVDEEALAAALADGTILAAGLDVFAREPHVPRAMLDLPNATLLPHVGSASVHTRNAMADLVVDNLVAWFSEGRPLTGVPETASIKKR